MSAFSDHQRLMQSLNKLAAVDKWRKMPKKKGTVKSVTLTKTGNIRVTFEDNSKAYVLKKNKNLFEVAEKLKQNDVISIATRRYLGKMYCTRIVVK